MFGKIDRLLHPRSHDELNGRGSAGPDPALQPARGPEMAKALGLPYRQAMEHQGRPAEDGEGVIGLTLDDMREMLDNRNR